MPVFEFECGKCECRYEELCKKDDIPSLKCPECGSKKKEQLISLSSFEFAQFEDTDRYQNSHDYRYHKKGLPEAMKTRENARKKSHMGQNPYNSIDDISSGRYFGDVK